MRLCRNGHETSAQHRLVRMSASGDGQRGCPRFRSGAVASALTVVLLLALGTIAPALAASNGASSPHAQRVTLPKRFEGSLRDVESQSPWTISSAKFSGYEVTFTFTNLVFGPGPQGPYTLLKGLVRMSVNFHETQTAPAGSDGTCTAIYEFSLNNASPFSGDLGGFSQTGRTWRATLALGVNTKGRVVDSTNCGPDLEFTANQFGKPPRIGISISATGTFFPSTGDLTFASKKTTTPHAGGTQTDTLTGSLRGSAR